MMPSDLQRLIDTATEAVQSSPRGDLPLSLRKRFWIRIAELSRTPLEARKRLTELERLCIGRVTEIWLRVFPSDQGVERMLEVARQALAGQIDQEKAQRMRDHFYVDVVENRQYKPGDSPAMDVGQAAASIVPTALFGVERYPGSEAENDEDLDPDSYETSYLTASAYAGGMADEGDPEKRREFWLWYLREAVPRAIEA